MLAAGVGSGSNGARTCSRISTFDCTQLLRPFCGVFFTCFVANRAGRWKAITPLIGPNRFNDHARIMSFLPRLNDWIQGATPCATQNVHRGCRIGASSDRPNNLIYVGDIDVLIDNNHVSTQVGTHMTLRRDQSSLLCMAWITLLDRYNNHEAL